MRLSTAALTSSSDDRYPFNDTTGARVIRDFSGNGFNASLKKGGTLSGSTLYLNGTKQYVALPSPFASKLRTLSALSCMTWFTPTTITTSTRLWDFGSDSTSKS